ncbi:MAG: Lignostilbene-alpha,beta-dioxygenase-related enzyme [Alphaproteobacteria bacterium]|jgi:carotenoid cleavage dioxygenase|nr:Lignostilbene-alpha,beta-dioxygenase-related enzyme [Alphaproteobacteria bacterium]
MSAPFPTTDPFLRGNYAPLLMESDAYDLPVTGEIPAALAGTLYRNGPNPQFAPRGFYHWFAGDGMLHALRVENGKVSYRNRWVRTPKWQMEHEAGKALYGAFGNPMWSDPVTFGKDSTTANTNVVWHGGKLLALEEAHLPFEVDAETLQPKGDATYGGKLQTKMTAHPKIDPETGEMVCFAYSAAGRFTPSMAYYTIDRSGQLTDYQEFDAPYVSMVHDFCVTRDFVLFPILPLTGSMERAMNQKPAFAWEPEKGNRIGILKRGDKVANMRWFTGDPSYVFHPMNAWNEGNRIFADVMEYPVAPLFPNPDGTPAAEGRTQARLVRWTFDLDNNSDTYRREELDDTPGEFPRFDERRAGLSYRHGYFTGYRPGKQIGMFDALGHIDFKTGKRILHALPEGDATSEAVFVPKSDSAPEGDGFLLSVVHRGAENRSDLCVFDAADIAHGPIATAHLPTRVPFGFHGNWRPH